MDLANMQRKSVIHGMFWSKPLFPLVVQTLWMKIEIHLLSFYRGKHKLLFDQIRSI